MHVIQVKKTAATVVQLIIQEDATLGSWGSHQLLIQMYKELEFMESNRMNDLAFNTAFLQEMLATYGELHCEYCGKQNLRIYSWAEKFKAIDGATTDHFIPKSRAPHLKYEKSNLKVCCDKCNKNKADKELPLESIKFPYK